MPTPSPEENEIHLVKARALKEEGNAKYLGEDYKAAIRSYHMCLLQARAVHNMAEGAFQKAMGGAEAAASSAPQDAAQLEAQEIVNKCYNNLAACILHGENRSSDDFLRGVEYCNRVLEKEPTNEKALFRKAQCLFHARDFEGAKEIFLSLENNAQAKQYVRKCQESMQEEQRKRDAEWRANVARVQARRQAHAQQIANNNLEAGAEQEPGPAWLENGTMPNGEVNYNDE